LCAPWGEDDDPEQGHANEYEGDRQLDDDKGERGAEHDSAAHARRPRAPSPRALYDRLGEAVRDAPHNPRCRRYDAAQDGVDNRAMLNDREACRQGTGDGRAGQQQTGE